MKKLILASLISVFFVACSGRSDLENKIFGGERTLRKMTNSVDVSVKSSFFLFFGNTSIKDQAKLIFAWKMNGEVYQISSVPIDEVRVRFDSTATSPRIKFIFRDDPLKTNMEKIIDEDIQGYFNSYLSYVEIVVKESDWQVDINMPLENEVK